MEDGITSAVGHHVRELNRGLSEEKTTQTAKKIQKKRQTMGRLTNKGRKPVDKEHVRVNQGNHGLLHRRVGVLEEVGHSIRLVVELEPAVRASLFGS